MSVGALGGIVGDFLKSSKRKYRLCYTDKWTIKGKYDFYSW